MKNIMYLRHLGDQKNYRLYSSMKIKLIESLCMVSVMKAVKIVLYILYELKKCHFHDSFYPLLSISVLLFSFSYTC